MNIHSRLKKIEGLTAKNVLDYCKCYEKHWRSAIDWVYNENPKVEMKVYPPPDFEKGYCDNCEKYISEKDIKTQKTLLQIYGD